MKFLAVIKWIIYFIGGASVLLFLFKLLSNNRYALLSSNAIAAHRRRRTDRRTPAALEDLDGDESLGNGFMGVPCKIVLATRGLLVSNGESQEVELLQEGVEFVRAVFRARPATDLYLLTTCSTDQTETTVRELVQASGLCGAGLNAEKVLFCSTETGKVHMTRTVQPEMYIDTSYPIAEQLQQFIPATVVVATASSTPKQKLNAEGVQTFASLRELAAIFA